HQDQVQLGSNRNSSNRAIISGSFSPATAGAREIATTSCRYLCRSPSSGSFLVSPDRFPAKNPLSHGADCGATVSSKRLILFTRKTIIRGAHAQVASGSGASRYCVAPRSWIDG